MAIENPTGWAVESPAGIPTIAVGNQKGGTGKTTTSINLPAAISLTGDKALAIDMDPQGDLTKGLGFGSGPDEEEEPDNPKHDLPNLMQTDDANLLDLLSDNRRTKDVDIEELIVHSEDWDHLNFDFVPSHADMSLARDWMANENARHALRNALEDMAERGVDYDYIIIDCPPDLSVLTDASFIAAQNVLLAAQTQSTSRDALDDLETQLEELEKNLKIEIALVGLFANMYRNDGQSKKFSDKFQNQWEERVPIFKLGMKVAIQRAWDNGMDIYEWEDDRPQETERELFMDMADGVREAFGAAPAAAGGVTDAS